MIHYDNQGMMAAAQGEVCLFSTYHGQCTDMIIT